MTARPAWVTDNALIVSLKRPINSTYLSAALRLANLNQFAGRSAQPLVSGTRIYPVEILVPTIEAQNAYEDRVNVIAQTVNQMNAAASAASSLFQSLQHRAFRGEL
jgi:type I restriction enzyme S subunit